MTRSSLLPRCILATNPYHVSVVISSADKTPALLLSGLQDIMLAGVDVPKLSAEDMPTAAASFATSSRVAAESSGSDSGMTDAPRNTPASDLILQMLKNTGSMAYVALLHGLPAIFDAATKNVLTGWWLFQLKVAQTAAGRAVVQHAN